LLNADLGWRGKELRSLSGGSPYEYDVDGHNQSLRAMHNLGNAQLGNSLSLGFERAAWDREVLGAFGSTASQRSRSFYIRDELTWKATGTRLSAGVRKETTQQDESGSALSPRTSNNAWELGVKQPLNASTSVYGRIGNSFRLANVDEFSFTAPGQTLKPQTSRDLELGAQYLTGAFKADLRWYQSALKNEIGYDPTIPNANSFSGFGANVNFDDTRRSGLELDGRYAVSPQLALQLNAAWRKAQFTAGAFAGKSVALVPNRTLSLRADWTPAVGHRLSGGVRIVSAQAPDFANLCRIPAFETVDVRYSMQWKSAEFSLGVGNLFDRKFYTQAFRCTAGVTTSIYPEAGREVSAAVKIAF
jgi:iron complex outermembrane recepter protein